LNILRLAVNGVCYNIERSGEGKLPLMLLHGFTGSAESWRGHTASFAQLGEVIALDFLGHGKSDAPSDPARYAMDCCVEDLVSIMDKLEIGRVNLLGYSMGGRVALVFANEHPERVNGMILESASPGIENKVERRERLQKDEELADRIEREGIEKFVEYWTSIPLFESQERLPRSVQEDLKRQRLVNTAFGLANSLRGLSIGRQESYTGQLSTISMPVLILAGELDTKFSGIANAMGEALPNGVVKIIQKAGHTIHLEQPEVFDAVVGEFVKEIGER
jgi:2-succinyl-6-hydroxy-2,4-cyclohexadiene-1-carboxylate synthase